MQLESRMHHHAEILDAVCDICRGTARLAEDTDGSTIVEVGSNRLFEPGDLVEILDDVNGGQMNMVAGLNGLTSVVMEAPVSVGIEVWSRGRIRLCDERVPKLTWVGRGSPKLPPQPAVSGFPCAIVEPSRLQQPLTGGTNRSVNQDYWTSVHYLRRRHQGEDEEGQLLGQVALLFDLLMRDPYLGGTCWHSQVRLVDHRSESEGELGKSDLSVRAVRLDVQGRRCELRE